MRSAAEVLRLAWPLMLAQAASALYDICDAWFLARCSSAAVVASLPARMVAGTLTTLFICSIGYVATFVAQFHGSGRERESVAAFAQGLWMSLLASPVFLLLIPASWLVIDLANHAAAVCEAEKAYLLVCAPGGVFQLLNVVLGGFFAGQGRTRCISLCAIAGCLVNFAGDWALVLGAGPLPALGISGAAIATVLGHAVQSALLGAAVFRTPLFRRHATWEVLRPRPGEMARILRHGVPTGVTAFASSFAFTVFSLVLTGFDLMSTNAAAAVFRANNVFYMALCAVSDSVLILVGRRHGAGDDAAARRAYAGGLRVVLVALALAFAAFFAFSDEVFDAFRGADATYDAPAYHALGRRLLVIMLFREAAEGVMCLTVGALRGAGDTRFVMWTQMACDLGFWTPLVICFGRLFPSLEALWLSMPANLALVAAILYARWRGGKWCARRLTSD